MTAAGRAHGRHAAPPHLRKPPRRRCARLVLGAAPALTLALLAVATVATVATGEGESVAASAGDGGRAARRRARFDPGCQAHSQCAPGEFCKAALCGTAWDVQHPCGACRRCEECECDSQAVDHYCPESCGGRRSCVCVPHVRCPASRLQRCDMLQRRARGTYAAENPAPHM